MARTFAQYGKMPEGPMSRVDLLEMLDGLVRRLGATGSNVTVRGERDVMVTAHHDALARSFHNLLLNAIEAQADVQPEVRIVVSRSGPDAVVEIADRGPGIPDDLLADVWDPDVTTKRGGTGLGLAIVRRTVELHGGSVEVANREGSGAVFHVRLPLDLDGGDGE